MATFGRKRGCRDNSSPAGGRLQEEMLRREDSRNGSQIDINNLSYN